MIEDNNLKENEKLDDAESVNENEILYTIEIVASASKLKAYLRIKTLDDKVKIPAQQVILKLREEGIVYGFNVSGIRKYLDEKDFFKELVIAEGKHPIDGKDAEIIFNFQTDDKIEFREREDGSVDFKNLDNIKSINHGGLLCTLVPETIGEDGKDIFGNVIPAKPGKAKELKLGRNTTLSEDGLKLHSKVDGCIVVSGDTVNVENIYKVSDVDQLTGNIDFVGSVLVSGDVKAGFKIKAKGDVVIKGMVEACMIETEGDITIGSGMNGRDIGHLKAGGNITSKYLENTIVEAGKNVFADAIVNSDVSAGISVITKGKRGVIIGGKVKASEKIQAKSIGSKNNIQTIIVIDLEAFVERNKMKLKNKAIIDRANAQIKEKSDTLIDYDQKIKYIAPLAKRSPDNAKLYKLLILNKSKLRKEINDLKTLIVEQSGGKNAGKITNYKVVCSGIIYANTRISIGWLKINVRDDISYSKIYNDGGELAVTQLTPADLEEDKK